MIVTCLDNPEMQVLVYHCSQSLQKAFSERNWIQAPYIAEGSQLNYS